MQSYDAPLKLLPNASLRIVLANPLTAALCFAFFFHHIPGVLTGVGLSKGITRTSSRPGATA